MWKHGFFDTPSNPSKKGIWLAGDYENSDVVTIPCDNDGDTKQGTTAAAMARLGLVFLLGVPPGSGEMLALLKKSSKGPPDPSYFTRDSVTNHLTHDQVILGKIGWGPLKSKRNVLSDLNLIVNPLGPTGAFIVCFTNIDQVTYFSAHVLWTFLETVRVYQSAAASAVAAPAAAAVGAAATP